ncbi:GPW/gp25 family protein [Streptomyces tagetis]|uniref:GPW/gp25 family protein n=1 Tax=Streptomyces tagetis TaxID=2820809 RepID=A0A940XMX3_9ACTN|nr:GPW/gp25 family protein [Streptomyces sp. RG38]MBQ0826643.1 GPW/gp25 family protein [Streptomyces sp. RG38]
MDLASGAMLLRQSVWIILVTEPGERLMRPDFGCGLRRFLSAPNTPGTRAAIARAVEDALSVWEPRITLSAVDVSPGVDPTLAVITVSYTHVRDGSAADLRIAVPVGTARTTGV